MNKLSVFITVFFLNCFSACLSPTQTDEKIIQPKSTKTTTAAKEGWVLFWSDEFSSFNSKIWNIDQGGFGWGNNELQYFTRSSKNVFIQNGALVLRALKENYYDKQYTSGRVNTFNKFKIKFGKIVFRAKLPKGKGLWPALWLFPSFSVYGPWPKSGEIDVMEEKGSYPNKVYGHINYGMTKQIWNGKSYTLASSDFSMDYHNFSIIWEKDKIRWYVDDNLYHTITPQTVAPEIYPFNEEFSFIMNNTVGGNFVGPPDASTTFPQDLRIDYVRIYKYQTIP